MSGTDSHRSATVMQAEGMVCVQTGCPIGQALELIAERAAVQGMTVEAVAKGVVDRTIRFGE